MLHIVAPSRYRQCLRHKLSGTLLLRSPASLRSPGGSLLPSTPGPSLLLHQRREGGSSSRRRGDPYTDWLLPLPPRRRPMDRGILAQQSDVRCKRGRLGGIMIAPAAHTSKGLAKAFVASAGGKGPENRDTPAPLSPTLRGARSRSSLPFRRGSLHPGHFLPL